MSLLRILVTPSLITASLIANHCAPAPGREPVYLTSQSCQGCHQDAYNAWSDSHHGWAWRQATPGNVLGDFSDTTFEHRGVNSRFFTREGRYFVDTDGPDGRRATYELAWTVGVTPLQQYLAELDDGRLQALDIAWDVERKRWYHLYPDQELANDSALHWTGPYKNWNARCVSCHVTGFTKGYDSEEARYQSTWKEAGVGCEACHGPGEAHVAWAEKKSAAPYVGVDALGLSVRFQATDAVGGLEVCAGCHSRRESLDADSPPPGEAFADHYRLTLLREGLYHADGQIDDEVYEYGSFLQSKMHARGVACGHCHEPHSGALVTEAKAAKGAAERAERDAGSNAVCTQCHRPEGNPEFPTLVPASYESPLHHRHPLGAVDATQCVSCHMPAKSYMVVDPRRDHSFRVPRPDLTVELGVPNACNGCHADRSAEWAQEQIAAWFPDGHHLRPHYGEVLQAGRRGLDARSVARLLDLANDAAQPAIVRASALELVAPVTTPQIAGATLPLLEDPNPLVRSAALGLLDPAPQAARAEHAGPLLGDPVRTVRITAAQRIVDIPTQHLNEADRAIVENAVGEYRASLAAHADFPEVQLNLARFAERTGRPRMAEDSLRAALALDPKLGDAWLRLAELQVEAGRFGPARQTLEQAIREVPNVGPLHQLYGRMLVKEGEQGAALGAFKEALRLLPDELEVRIEYVSLLSQAGKPQQALEALAQAADAPDNTTRHHPEMLYLLAYNHALLKQMDEARRFARELRSHHPEHALNQHIESFLAKD